MIIRSILLESISSIDSMISSTISFFKALSEIDFFKSIP